MSAPPVSLRPVRVFRLRLWLPLSLVLASAVLFAMFLLVQRHHYNRELEHFANSTAHAELLQTQRALETVLRRGDGSGTEGVVSHLGLNPVIAHAALLGPMARWWQPPGLPGKASGPPAWCRVSAKTRPARCARPSGRY